MKPKQLAERTVWIVREGFEYVAILGLRGQIVGRNKFKSTLIHQIAKQAQDLNILAVAPVIAPDKRIPKRGPNKRGSKTWNPT